MMSHERTIKPEENSRYKYRVWVCVEQEDTETGEYEALDSAMGCTAIFDTEEEAQDFAERMHTEFA